MKRSYLLFIVILLGSISITILATAYKEADVDKAYNFLAEHWSYYDENGKKISVQELSMDCTGDDCTIKVNGKDINPYKIFDKNKKPILGDQPKSDQNHTKKDPTDNNKNPQKDPSKEAPTKDESSDNTNDTTNSDANEDEVESSDEYAVDDSNNNSEDSESNDEEMPLPAEDPSEKPSNEPEVMKGMVAAHNACRKEVGIPSLVWSDKLAAYAQEWANNLKRQGCDMNHRSNNKYGENLAWSSGANLTPKEVVQMWYSEKKDYDYRTNTCRGVCGHYTQIVWKNTKQVGCAVAYCSDSEIWVCNYDPPGNYVGQKPY